MHVFYYCYISWFKKKSFNVKIGQRIKNTLILRIENGSFFACQNTKWLFFFTVNPHPIPFTIPYIVWPFSHRWCSISGSISDFSCLIYICVYTGLLSNFVRFHPVINIKCIAIQTAILHSCYRCLLNVYILGFDASTTLPAYLHCNLVHMARFWGEHRTSPEIVLHLPW